MMIDLCSKKRVEKLDFIMKGGHDFNSHDISIFKTKFELALYLPLMYDLKDGIMNICMSADCTIM